MGKLYGSRYARIGGTPTFWSGTPTFSSGTPTFCQMGVLNSCFQNPSESSESDQGLYYLPITVLNMLDQVIIIEPRHVISNMFQPVAF